MNQNKRSGFTAIHAVMAIGLIAVVLLAFFGLPAGVKDFFTKFGGKSKGLASITAFGEFGGDTANPHIDDVAKTIYTDLINVREATKSESKDIKNGICFKNPANEKDFYNIISDVKNTSACAEGESTKTVVSLPNGTIFIDPVSASVKYVVFNKDGTTTADRDISIKVSNSTGIRMIVVTPLGVITYTDKIPSTVSSNNHGGSSVSPVAGSTSNLSAAELAKIAAGLASVLNGIQALQAQSIIATTVNPTQPVQQPVYYYYYNQPSTPAPTVATIAPNAPQSAGNVYYVQPSSTTNNPGNVYYAPASNSTTSTNPGNVYYAPTSNTSSSPGNVYYAPASNAGTTNNPGNIYYAPASNSSTSTNSGNVYYAPASAATSSSAGNVYYAPASGGSANSAGNVYYASGSSSASAGNVYYAPASGSTNNAGNVYYAPASIR